jgi:hypothetical protein
MYFLKQQLDNIERMDTFQARRHAILLTKVTRLRVFLSNPGSNMRLSSTNFLSRICGIKQIWKVLFP